MSHIFVSYSRKDSTCVYAAVDALKRHDFPIWLDTESIQITDEWLAKIESAIDEAMVFMLFWSANAAASDYVAHELRMAKSRSINGEIKVLAIMLDDTDLPMPHIQAYDMKSGCDASAIARFVNNLPDDWRAFNYDKTLGEQAHTDAPNGNVSVLYDKNATCRAYIVGPADAKLPQKPAQLGVALQFFRPTDADMLESVMHTLPDTWLLHITGPVQGDQYRLNDADPAQWEASRDFIVRMIQRAGHQPTTQLHFFTLTPNALLGGVTMPLYRFWHVTLYNFIPAENRYAALINLPRS